MSTTFASDFLARCRESGDEVAFSWPGGRLSRAGFADLVIAFARQLQAREVTPASLIAIDCESWVTGMGLVFAAALLGAGIVEARPDLNINGIRITHYLFTTRERAISNPRAFAVTPDWRTLPPGTPNDLSGFPAAIDPASVFALLRSSGTSGTPKYMPVSYGLQATRLAQMQGIALPPAAIAFPPLSYSGMITALGVLLGGAPITMGRTLEDLKEQGTGMFSGSPAQVESVLSASTGTARLPFLGTGGGMVTPRLIAHWQQFFDTISVSYGTTEVGSVASSLYTADWTGGPVALSVLPGREVEIVAEDGTILPEGMPGEVRLRTTTMVPAYENQPALNAKHFRDGWFYPGDIGTLEGGRLTLHGRTSEQFEAGGVKINAVQVDEIASAVSGVVAAMSYPEMTDRGLTRLGLLVVPEDPASPAALAATIRAALAPVRFGALVPETITFVDRLPYNANGKLMRHEAVRVTVGADAY